MRTVLRYAPPLLWAVAITWAATRSRGELPAWEMPLGVDKLIHAAMYGVLAWLMLRAAPQLPLVWLFVFCGIHGAAIELWQAQIPGRSAEFLDLAADCAGALGGGLTRYMPLRSQNRRRPQR